MKHFHRSFDSLWDDFQIASCPAGCRQCSYDKDRFSVRFSLATLLSQQSLPQSSYRAHRILFLFSGSLSAHFEAGTRLDLYAGQCVFLARTANVTVQAHADSNMILLDFNNRLIFCHRDLLQTMAAKRDVSAECPPVMHIHEKLQVFFQTLRPVLEARQLQNPCYHIVKEHELFLLMWHFYGETCLGCFFREILRPRDDFRLFVQNSYLKADDVAGLARMANMSERTFARRFKETFDESYHSWRVKQKAEDIRQAIRDGVLETEELIRLFSFPSYRAFYNFCLRHIGTTPKGLIDENAVAG